MLNVPTCLPSTCGFELNVVMARFAGGVSWLIWIVPLPDGQPVGAGAAGFSETTPVGTEVDVPEPSAFFAVTRTRSVCPTSALRRSYRRRSAPLIPAQLPPFLSQRWYWYEYEVGLPVHWPWSAVRVDPSCAVPLIVGGVVLVGAALDAARPRPAVPNTAPITTAATAMSDAVATRTSG